MEVVERNTMVKKIMRIGNQLRAVTDSRPLLDDLIKVATEYRAKEDVQERKVPVPKPEPRVEHGGVNRMEPASTPTITRKKKSE